MNSDFATFVRTIVILLALGVILLPLASGRHPARSLAAAMCFSSSPVLRRVALGSAISVLSNWAMQPALRRSTN